MRRVLSSAALAWVVVAGMPAHAQSAAPMSSNVPFQSEGSVREVLARPPHSKTMPRDSKPLTVLMGFLARANSSRLWRGAAQCSDWSRSWAAALLGLTGPKQSLGRERDAHSYVSCTRYCGRRTSSRRFTPRRRPLLYRSNSHFRPIGASGGFPAERPVYLGT